MRLFTEVHRSTVEELRRVASRGAVTIGNFDGVHRGHAKIIEQLVQAAQRVGGPAVVFTFDPHPVRLLRPEETPPPLTWTDRKATLLGELGVDVMIAYPTDAQILQLTPGEFFQQIVGELLAARAMVEGPNFYFGRDRTGDIHVLRELCDDRGIELEIAGPVTVDGKTVSSSRVRKLIVAGEVEAAAHLLTKPYRLRGMVTHGARRGATIGFPTANVDAIDTIMPCQGVYAGCTSAHGKTWPSAIHIGPNPTFQENVLKVEAHLIGFEGSLYGMPLEVDFLAKLRGIRPFESVDALVAQLHKDIDRTKQIVRERV